MDTKALFNDRRSVNYFDTNRSVDDTTLRQIIDMAVLAPSAFNLQPWRLIALRSTEAKAQLYDLAHRQDKVKEASVVLIVVGNKAGYTNANPVWDEMLASVGGNQQMVDGAKQAAAYLYGSSDERKLKFAESNASLLAMALMIAAKEYGVDSHPMSGLDFDGIHQQFHLLPDEVVVMTICLGFADETKKLFDRRPRRSFDQICSVI